MAVSEVVPDAFEDFEWHCCVGRKPDYSLPRRHGRRVCKSDTAPYLGRSESPISDSTPDRRVPRRLNATVPGQIIDVFVSPRRDTRAARRFFEIALGAHGKPVEVVTDRAPALRAVIEELIPTAFHNAEQHANNRIEADHGRLKARLRPMRGLKRDHTARVIIRGHALMQNLRRGHYELGVEARAHWRVAAAFTQLARTI
jgi:hypothetical protein